MAASLAPTRTALIEAEHVSKSFPSADGSILHVLDDVTVTLHEGEVVALLGKSGSGKSTLLRTLAGLIAPSAGEVRYRGTPLNGANPGAAMVFQSFALMPCSPSRTTSNSACALLVFPRKNAASAPWTRSTRSAWTASRPPTPANYPAACDNESASPAPSSSNPTCS